MLYFPTILYPCVLRKLEYSLSILKNGQNFLIEKGSYLSSKDKIVSWRRDGGLVEVYLSPSDSFFLLVLVKVRKS